MRFPKHVLMEESTAESTIQTGTPATASSPAPAASEAPAVVAPAAPAAVVAHDADEGKSVDWLEESNLEGEGEGPIETVVVAPAPAAAPAKPAPVAVVAPAAATPTPAVATPASAPAVAAPAQPTASVAETPEAKTARETAAAAEEKQYFDSLTAFYKIPEDMAAKLTTEPENVLPLLAAKVHQAVIKGVQNYMAQQLPGYIMQTQQLQVAEEKSKSAFYDAWPTLKPYEAQVLQVGKLYRSMNPTADAKTAIKAIGEIVSTSLGIAVATPSAAAPAAVAASTGHIPSGASGSRGAAPASADNEFTKLALEED